MNRLGKERQACLLEKGPVLAELLEQVRPRSRELVVEVGRAGEHGLTTGAGHVHGVQREDISEVCVKSLVLHT